VFTTRLAGGKGGRNAFEARATTLAELQVQLDAYTGDYNHRRPHRSQPHRATPVTIYAARPKADPSNSHRRPQPRPHRTRRPNRISHPARQWPPAPHRHRPHPPTAPHGKTADLKKVRGYSNALRHHMVGLTGFEPATT
jgi:hypothetical protein